jgi:hypothetical protein
LRLRFVITREIVDDLRVVDRSTEGCGRAYDRGSADDGG